MCFGKMNKGERHLGGSCEGRQRLDLVESETNFVGSRTVEVISNRTWKAPLCGGLVAIWILF
jgi:hypothetical protein